MFLLSARLHSPTVIIYCNNTNCIEKTHNKFCHIESIHMRNMTSQGAAVFKDICTKKDSVCGVSCRDRNGPFV